MFRSKKLSLVCCVMIVLGLLLSGTGYLLGGRVWGIGLNMDGIWVNSPNVQGNRGYSYVKRTEELEPFTGIDASVDFGDLIIEPSDHYGISYYLPEDCRFDVTVEDGVLQVVRSSHPTLGFQGNLVVIGMGDLGGQWKNEYIKISIPAGVEFDSVKLVSESGNISAESFRAKSFYAETDFGNAGFADLQCDETEIQLESGRLILTDFGDGALTIENQFGEAVLERVTASQSQITMESGDFRATSSELGELTLVQKFGAVRLDGVVCGNAAVTAESGEIQMSQVTAAELKIDSNFGDVGGEDVHAQSGVFVLESGVCKFGKSDIPDVTVQSGFGDVRLELTDEVTAYTLDLDTEFGVVEVDQQDMGTTYRSLETHEKRIGVHCESGDIVIRGGE